MSLTESFTFQDISTKCPKIGISVLREYRELIPSGQIRLNGDPFHMGEFRPGSEWMACDYDMPGGTLSQVLRGLTRGPIIWQGKQCLELVAADYNTTGDYLGQTRHIVDVGPRFSTVYLTQNRRADGHGSIEKIHQQTPQIVSPDSRWRVTDTFLQPDGSYRSRIRRQKIGGVFTVYVGKAMYPCIQWIRTRITDAGYEEAEEVFVSLRTGLTVLIRHYIGQGWPGLDEFKKSPKMESDGRIYYLWFVRRVLRTAPSVAA